MNDGNNSTTTDSSDHPQTLSPDLQIQTQTPFSDPLTNPHLSLNDLSPELTSLHELAIRGSWRSIIDKVAQARKLSLPTTQPHHNLTYTSYYLLALTKLRRYDEALLDLSNLHDLDSPHYHYESYPDHYPNRYGSMVPFSLRWIHAQIPFRLGNRQETLDRLYTLLDFVRTKLKDKESKNLNDSVSIWNNREDFVTNSIISHHLSHKEFIICLDLIRRDSSNPILLSKLGYIQMQLGDLEGAKAMFNRVEGLMGEGKSGELLTDIEFKNLVNRNKALVYLVGKDYVSAVREYEECIERDSSDAVAINNKALCLMYLRDLSDSIKVLENALERVPTAALNETIVVNLCSMYELAYVNHSDIKRTLSNWIAQVAPDDFDASCTRI